MRLHILVSAIPCRMATPDTDLPYQEQYTSDNLDDKQPSTIIDCLSVQGFSQAKLAWKKKNAIPQTNKEAKAQRPDGRGDGGARGSKAAPNRGGGRAPIGMSRECECGLVAMPAVSSTHCSC